MTYANDDLTSILVPPPSAAVRYGQGRIVTWNPQTFENQIEWRGITLTNLPVLAATDALTFRPGDVVGLLGWAPNPGGPGSWWILGKLILPRQGAASDVVGWLGSSLALSVMAATYTADTVLALESTTSTSPADLNTVGPRVTVNIGQSGRMLVTISADIRPPLAVSGSIAITTHAFMGFQVDGDTERAANTESALALIHRDDFQAGGEGSADAMIASRQALVTGLNPGRHVVTAKYWRAGSTANAGPAEFADRVIAVQAF